MALFLRNVSCFLVIFTFLNNSLAEFKAGSFDCDLTQKTPPREVSLTPSGSELVADRKESDPEGKRCGADPKVHTLGVGCHAVECMNSQIVSEMDVYQSWQDFEPIINKELTSSGFSKSNFDFSDFCPNAKNFDESQKRLLMFDIIKTTVSRESGFRTLMAYDDIINGKVDTSRGFGSQTRETCKSAGVDTSNYCDLHLPSVGVRCITRVIMQEGQKYKREQLQQALSHKLGVWSTNSGGGRYNEFKTKFSRYEPCQTGSQQKYESLPDALLGLEIDRKGKESVETVYPPRYTYSVEDKACQQITQEKTIKYDTPKSLYRAEQNCQRCWVIEQAKRLRSKDFPADQIEGSEAR